MILTEENRLKIRSLVNEAFESYFGEGTEDEGEWTDDYDGPATLERLLDVLRSELPGSELNNGHNELSFWVGSQEVYIDIDIDAPYDVVDNSFSHAFGTEKVFDRVGKGTATVQNLIMTIDGREELPDEYGDVQGLFQEFLDNGSIQVDTYESDY